MTLTAANHEPLSREADRTTVSLGRKTLAVRFGAPQRVLSWAIVGGGMRTASDVVWREVCSEDLKPPTDARDYLQSRLNELKKPDAVGLLTSRDVSTFVHTRYDYGSIEGECIATVGLGNALRVGDAPGASGRIGTINLVCRVSCGLTDNGLAEAMSVVTEARTLAVYEANLPSRRSFLRSTGTGTDCSVVASALGGHTGKSGSRTYCGKHTDVGHVIGHVVYQAVSEGASRWLTQQRIGSR